MAEEFEVEDNVHSEAPPGQAVPPVAPSFRDPRLRMTWSGRSSVRIVSSISNFILAAAALGFLISDQRFLQGTGIFITLFFIDRLMHFGEADVPLTELPASGPINVAKYMAPSAFAAIERAFDRSILRKEYFLLALGHELLNHSEVNEGLRRLDVKPEEFKAKLESFIAESGSEAAAMTREAVEEAASAVALEAFAQALREEHRFVEISDLFGALAYLDDEKLKRLFNLFAIEAGDLERALLFGWNRRRASRLRRMPKNVGGFRSDAHRELRHRVMNRAWTARPTPTLDRYGIDYTDLARNGEIGFLVGHKGEYERLVDALARPVNPNALLVGEEGIGKEAVIAHLAFDLNKDRVPAPLFDKRLVALQLSSLVAGAPPDELHKRLQTIVEEITTAGNLILYIPDIHNLVRTSGTAYMSAADALIPIIKDNLFPIIGVTYPREFKEFLEPRSDFIGLFEVIRVQEIAEEDAEKILVYESLILERQTGIEISFGAIKEAVTLAKKYFHTKFLPSSGAELLKGALVEAQRLGEHNIGPDRVIHVAEEKVNIPIHKTGEEEAQALLHLEESIHENYIDQDEAVKAIATALREYRAGITRPGGPIASFLFVGPTGVGKTELAKILAKVQFGSMEAMIRFDMTEYQDKQSFYRFIGSPDGSMSGALTDAVLHKPYCLVLLDEFEKAFPDILNLFLQVFDDGRLTDNLSRTVDFQNTIIIATSNAHSDIINESLRRGESMVAIAEYLKQRLVDVFKPELLNRFSRIVVFHDLAPADLEKVVALNLADLSALAEKQGIKLIFDPEAVRKIAHLGYDPNFGARPLRRLIDDKLRAPLAEEILKQEVRRGTKLRITVQGDEFRFEIAADSASP